MIQNKKCPRCKETKPTVQFYKDKSKTDGFQSNCIPCRREILGRNCINTHRKKLAFISIKIKVQKDFNSFWINFRRAWIQSEIYKKWAKTEHLKKTLQWAKDNPDKARAKNKKYADANREKIRERAKIWRKENKEKLKKSKAKHRAENKDKINKANQLWRIKNREKIRERERIRQSTPEFKAKRKAYYQDNRSECIRRSTEWSSNYRKTPMGTMQNRLRVRLSDALRRGGYTKRSRTNEIIGCSWHMLVKHIENQFDKGMTWDNRGDWHIDHIVPLSSANNEKELLRLCHFSNLQPLWKEDNLKKSNKIIECQPELLLKY